MKLNLKLIREEKLLQQKEVAKKAGISNSYYCLIESGFRRPSPPVAQKIATALGVSEEWYKLLEDTEITPDGAAS